MAAGALLYALPIRHRPDLHMNGTVPPAGFVEQGMPFAHGLAGEIPDALRTRVTGYLDKVRNDDPAGFPFFENPGKATTNIETSCFAVQALAHVHARNEFERFRESVAASLEGFFNPAMGIYETTETQMGPIATGIWRIHNDAICRITLRALGLKPRPWPRRIERLSRFPWAWQPGTSLEDWLRRAWINGPRRGAKEVSQFLLVYCELMGFASFAQFDENALRVVEFLESQRDPETGYISKATDIRPGWGMRGHRNLALAIHWRYGIPEPMLPEMINSTLACQRGDGLFDDGSMCANMDAVHLLAEYGLRTNHRYEEAIDATRRCIRAMFELLSVPSGGFRYEFDECPDPMKEGYGNARTTNGLAFVLFTLRFWQALDPEARRSLPDAMARISAL